MSACAFAPHEGGFLLLRRLSVRQTKSPLQDEGAVWRTAHAVSKLNLAISRLSDSAISVSRCAAWATSSMARVCSWVAELTVCAPAAVCWLTAEMFAMVCTKVSFPRFISAIAAATPSIFS